MKKPCTVINESNAVGVKSKLEKDGLIWLDADRAPFVIYGATQTSPYYRMPQDIARSVNEMVFPFSRNTAGIRARFRTDSPYIAIRCEWENQCRMSHMTDFGSCGFDLYAVSGGKPTFQPTAFMPPVPATHGYEAIVERSEGMTDYILNFPLYNEVSKLYIGVRKGSAFEVPARYGNKLPVVFYGSSITQGACASRPGNCYPNFLSRMLNMDYVNLGFSSGARGEEEMARYLAGLAMSAFVCDYDHNAPDPEHLKNTHFHLYKTIRQRHPDVPYVMLTKPDFRGNAEDIARRCIIMETYKRAVDNGDKNVYFIDGASFFATDEQDAHTVDGCHPNDLGFYRMAKALYPVLRKILL